MGNFCELSYCELRAKEIINTADGRRLGRITDIVFSADNGEVKGIVVPYVRKFFFSRSQEIFIPWNCINKIGDDVILVHIIGDGFSRGSNRSRRNKYDDYGYCPPPPPRDCGEPCPPPHCDGAHPHHDDSCCDTSHCDNTCCDTPHFDCGCPPHGAPISDGCPPKGDRPDCDGKCEKCMLFDCAYRWKNC